MRVTSAILLFKRESTEVAPSSPNHTAGIIVIADVLRNIVVRVLLK
jgi:hypothetical protein